MSELERIEQRLSAVERVVVDGEFELDELAALASLSENVDRLDARLRAHERRIAELEGTLQSLEGYVGNVESINDDVERQAAVAVAVVDRLERRIEAIEVALEDSHGEVTIESASAESVGPTSTVADERAAASVAHEASGSEPTPDEEETEDEGSDFATDSESGPERVVAEITADASERFPNRNRGDADGTDETASDAALESEPWTDDEPEDSRGQLGPLKSALASLKSPFA